MKRWNVTNKILNRSIVGVIPTIDFTNFLVLCSVKWAFQMRKGVKTFTYQFEAIEYLRKEHNITSTVKISAVLTGKRGNSAGFVFKYK